MVLRRLMCEDLFGDHFTEVERAIEILAGDDGPIDLDVVRGRQRVAQLAADRTCQPTIGNHLIILTTVVAAVAPESVVELIGRSHGRWHNDIPALQSARTADIRP